MTDNEIIKSMQCVIGNDVNCSECTYQKKLPFPSCRRMCAKNALDLINRQKAENERLEKELMKCKLEKEMLYQTVEEIKSEAIKEFAERLKARGALFDSDDVDYVEDEGHLLGNTLVKLYVSEKTINNLVKEMTEVNENDR